MVSTDGHRLSLFEKKNTHPPEERENSDTGLSSEKTDGMNVIVPPKVLIQATRVAIGVQEPGKLFFDVTFGKGAILFNFGTTLIFSKLIEGPYPDFRRVIPVSSSKHVTVNTDEFSSSVRRVSVLSNTLTHQIRVSLTDGLMEVSTSNIDIGGESRETFPVLYEGEPLMVGYNAQFLSEIFRVIDSEEIVLELESPTSACIIKPAVKKELKDYYYLIMPLRLNE
jgi:DNA polymerase-3 subunit beta